MTEKSDLSYVHGHRARLREKFIETRLVDYELLELLLSYAIPRVDVKPIVKELLKTFGGLHGILAADHESLTRIRGISDSTAIFLRTIHEVMLRDHAERLREAPIFHDITVLENYAKTLYLSKTIEEFHVLYLNGDNKLIRDDLHTTGTIDWTAVHPREIVKRAISLDARGVILLHNHPTGGNAFSVDDIEITQRIKSMLAVMNIQLADHFLVANGIVYSAKNMGVL